MTNYRQQLTTADEALAYAKAHPDCVLHDKQGNTVRLDDLLKNEDIFIEAYAPYTVIKTGNTITIGKHTYSEGDYIYTVDLAGYRLPSGLTFEGLNSTGVLKLLHIPDEVADKPAPKKPKTITLENFMDGVDAWFINGANKVPCRLNPLSIIDSYAAYGLNGQGKDLYPTPEDAQLAIELGLS
jgi:hypothetical protein